MRLLSRRSALLFLLGITGTRLVCHAESGPALGDPTRPVDTSATVVERAEPVELPTWKLSGIKITKHHRLAVINNMVIPLHGKLGSARVIEIEATHVVIEQNGRRQVLPLMPAGVKKRVARRNTQ